MIRTKKYALYPNKVQEEKIKNNIQAVSKLRSLYLEDLKNKTIISTRATEIVKHYIMVDEMLAKDVDFGALMNEMFSLIDGKIDNVDKKMRGYTTKINSYLLERYPNKGDRIFIPKVGYVKYVNHYEIPRDAAIISYHIFIDSIDRYFIEIVFDNHLNNPPLRPIEKVIGLDYSARHLVVDSNGEKHTIEIPNHEKNLMMINKLQKLRSKCQKGSNRYKSYTLRINKIYKREANYRMDYLHKLSRELANEYDCVAIEDLSMKQMVSKNHMGKSTMNNGFYKFTSLLTYKLAEQGKTLIKIDKYFPSSKTCSACKRIRPSLELNERTWICEKCGTVHDRDVNAAINIKEEALRIIKNTPGWRCASTQIE